MAGKNEFELKASDGVKLKGRIWGDPLKAKALILLIHGLGEHIRRYDHVAAAFEARGLCLIGYDQRGFGRSGGRKGHIPSEEQFMADITQAIHFAKSKNVQVPLFLYGHSMGAMEVLFYGLKYKPNVKGVLATSPLLDVNDIDPKKVKLMKLMVKILPGLAVKNDLALDGLSRDVEVVQAYRKDRLVHDKISVQLGKFIYDAPQYVLEHAREWTLPLYLAHGTEDLICPIRGSDAFFEKANGPILYKRWDGLYHETHNEPEKDTIIGAMMDWIETQI